MEEFNSRRGVWKDFPYKVKLIPLVLEMELIARSDALLNISNGHV